MKKLLKIFIIIFIILIICILITLYKIKEDTSMENSIKENIAISNSSKPVDSNNIQNNSVVIENPKDNSIKFEMLKDRKVYLELEDVVLNLISDMKLYNSEASINAMYNVEGPQLIEQKKQEIKLKLNSRISNKCNLEEVFNSETFKNIIIKETYSVNSIYERKSNSNIKVYLIYGEFSKSKTEYVFIVILDEKNKAYEVYLNNYVKNNYDLEDTSSINIEKDNIIKNKYNIKKEYTEKEADKKIAQRYFLTTKNKLDSNPEEIYNKLYSTYKETFKNLEDFKKFAKTAQFSKFEEYKVVEKDTHFEIICTDELGSKIIFKERAIMNYTIILDPYRVALETLTAEYNVSDEEKVMINIQKIAQMINMRDYNELYKVLNSKFRVDNFREINNLKEYINKNFYERNKFELISSEKEENGYYIIKLQIRNELNKAEKKEWNVIMKIVEESTQFEISFNKEV